MYVTGRTVFDRILDKNVHAQVQGVAIITQR